MEQSRSEAPSRWSSRVSWTILQPRRFAAGWTSFWRTQTITHLVLDLENLTFMDSSGIGMLLGRLRALQARGGSLSVMHMQPPVEKLFRLSGLDRVIGVEDDIRGGRL